MKKLLSLGFILVLCGSLVGCSEKLSDKEIEKCVDMEYTIDKCYNGTENIICEIGNISRSFINGEVKVDVEQIENYSLDLIEYEELLSEIKLNELKKYHDYMVEYSGTSQREEDYKFTEKNYQYLLTQRMIAYIKEIFPYLEDGDLSSVERDFIKPMKIIADFPVSKDDTDEELKKLQADMDSKYGLDSQKLYDIKKLMYSLNDNNEE